MAHISLDGGVLCLDFVNTIHDRKNEPERDYLEDPVHLFYWSERLGVINATTLRLLEKSAAKKKKALLFFKEAIRLRELLYRIFRSISRNKKVASTDLSDFNNLLSRYFPFLRLKQKTKGFEEDWNLSRDQFYRTTAPIINSAYELLMSDKLSRIKECPNCGWLFLDATKNGKRRWCNMKNCGSSIKALEWYHRQKQK